MSAMGAKTEMMDLPVCTSFKEIVFNDQLCYQVDVSRLNVTSQISSLGLTFAIDTNEDRQVQLNTTRQSEGVGENIMEASIMRMEENKKALVYIGSLGDLRFPTAFNIFNVHIQRPFICMEKEYTH